MAGLKINQDLPCPFIDANDPRCAARFSLRRIDEAFGVCLSGGYAACPAYRQLVREREHGAPDHLAIHLTIEGRRVGQTPGRRGRALAV